MSRNYYVIELSARWLTVLLIALALIMVIAFALGYGAAWSVLTAEQTEGQMTALQAAATPTEIPEMVIPTSVPTSAAKPTETSTPSPTATPPPVPTTTPTPQPTPTAAATEFFVQVLASAQQQSVEAAQTRLEGDHSAERWSRRALQVEDRPLPGPQLCRPGGAADELSRFP
jgi:type IV secretory pathway VirB10-like protein